MVEQAWPALEQLGLAEGADPSRLSFSDDLAVALEGAEFVQESSPEREDLKIELFAALPLVLLQQFRGDPRGRVRLAS